MPALVSAGYSILWLRLVAVIFATAAVQARADEPAASGNDAGGKMVTVVVRGKKMKVRVLDNDPYSHFSSDAPDPKEKYDPQRFSFNTASPMANKSFDIPNNPIAHSDPDFTGPDHTGYLTKSYSDQALSAGGFDAKSSFASVTATTRNAAEFTKGFAGIPRTDSSLTKSAALPPASATADLNHAAVLGGSDPSDFLTPNSMATKQYLGPGAQHVPDGVAIKDNVVLSRMSGLPDRPLTVDEVRNLINHAAVPNLNEKPEEPSKPLNDPHYQPEPLRDDPSPGSPAEEDKNDAVPPPGTMAAPPAEPLPQR